MGRQLEALSCVEERKPRPIMNPGDNWSGGDGEGQQLENALTKNTGLAMGQVPLRTDSQMVLTGVETVVGGKEKGTRFWRSLSARLMKPGLLSLK